MILPPDEIARASLSTTIAVCVVVPPVVCTVPVSFGNVIVLSAVGSTTVNVVSKPSSVALRIQSYHLLLHLVL